MNQRYYALDVFRGMTVALMILVNTPGSWSFIYPPLRHAEWHGITPTDLVFPFFLFAVGNAMAFVMPKFQKQGNAVFWNKILKRTALIFIIGLLLNWFPFVQWHNNALEFKPWSYDNGKNSFGGVRFLGVLQRIAICYFFASVTIYYAKRNLSIAIGSGMLLLYWAICYLFNPSDPYSLTGWIGNNIDVNVIGKKHLYFSEVLYYNTPDSLSNGIAKTSKEIGIIADSLQQQYGNQIPLRDSMLSLQQIIVKPSGKNTVVLFDPEGLLSTISAIVQVIFGYAVGKFILDNGSTRKTVEKLLLVGLVLCVVGRVWHEFFPINKKIWTSSYTVITTGMAMLFIGVFVYLFELIKIPKIWGKFFDAFGKNPLFIFVLSGALPRLLSLMRIPNGLTDKGVQKYTSPLDWLKLEIFMPISTDKQVGSFLFALFMIIFYWLIAYIMDKKKIYVKV